MSSPFPTNAILQLDSHSVDESVVTEQSENTFFPPISPSEADSGSAIFTAPVRESTTEIQLLDFGSGYEVTKDIIKPPHQSKEAGDAEGKRRKFLALLLLGVVIFVIGAVAGVMLSLSLSANESSDLPPSGDFCASVGVSDAAMRNILANDFETARTDQFSFDFQNPSIVCLPSNIFSGLSEPQLTVLNEVPFFLLAFSRVPIRAVHPQAFAQDFFLKLISFVFDNTELTALPDDLFNGCDRLGFLKLDRGLFTTLNNNILGNTKFSLGFLSMTESENLVEFPEFMAFAPNLNEIVFQNCPRLTNFNIEAFNGVNGLSFIRLEPSNIGLNVSQIRDALGLDINVTIQV